MSKDYLITYTPIKGHKDPDFKELVYGDSGQRGETLKKNLTKESYIFFHTSIGSTKYITCYLVISDIIWGKDIKKNSEIKYDAKYDDWVFIGDKIKSKVLKKPLPLNKSLAQKLSLGIDFSDYDNGKRSELQVVASATRSQRTLTKKDVSVLLDEIDKYENNNKIENPEDVQYHLHFYDEGGDIIPIDEVHKIHESEIQKLIRKNPTIIEDGTRIIDYERVLPDGDRLDILLEDRNGSLIVAELKGPNRLSDAISTQVASYARDIQRQYPEKKIRKMIICDGKVSPKLQKACELLNIEIVVYGVKLDCFKL